MALETKLIILLVLVSSLCGGGWYVHHRIYKSGFDAGKAEIQAERDADKAKAVLAAEEDRKVKEAEIAGVGLAFVEKAAKERVITRTIIQQVNKYVPSTDPVLSGGFRLLHDASASGEEPADSAGTAIAGVASSEVASTVALNYAACRYDQSRLEALQEIVKTLNGHSP